MYNSPKVCIIGPSVGSRYLGGVATHIRTLKSLPCFSDAVVFDPGSINSNVKTDLFQVAKAISGLRKKILAGQFNYVLVNTSIYTFSFLKLLWILSSLPRKEEIKIHVFFHGGRFPFFNQAAASALNHLLRPILNKAEKFHFLSLAQQNSFRKIFAGYENGLYANYSLYEEVRERNAEFRGNPLNLLFVGRIVREKGIFELIAAVDELSKSAGNFKLTIAGDGPALEQLLKISATMAMGLVDCIGHISGPRLDEAYRKAEVLMLPSYHEAFPYTVIEAMRNGLPIICTNAGALENLVRDGVTGFKVQPRNVASIVTALKKFQRNKALLEEMSRNCYRYFKGNLSRSAAEQFYSQLMGIQTNSNVHK